MTGVPAERTLDLRFEKSFSLAGNNRIGIYADVLNAFNRGVVTNVLTRVPSTTVTTPTGTVTLPFETPGTIQSARQVLFGGRWSF